MQKKYIVILFIYTFSTFMFSQNGEQQKKESAKTDQVLKTDKELAQKIQEIKEKQITKITNFTPGFKAALDAFFAYEWHKALERERDQKIQDEIKKITQRLQDDYKQLITEELIANLSALGNYYSKQKISPEEKKQLIQIISDAKNAHSDIHQATSKQEARAKEVLSPVLAFAQLAPSPYEIWYTIQENAGNHKVILEKMHEIIIPLVQENNTGALENHLQKAKQAHNSLLAKWKVYQEKVKMFLDTLEAKAEQEQNLTAIMSKISLAKNKVMDQWKMVITDMRALNAYATFIPSDNFLQQWLTLASSMQKLMNQWDKIAKDWQNRLQQEVMRKKVIYEYLTKNEMLHDVETMLEVPESTIKNKILLENVIKSLTQQKSGLQLHEKVAKEN